MSGVSFSALRSSSAVSSVRSRIVRPFRFALVCLLSVVLVVSALCCAFSFPASSVSASDADRVAYGKERLAGLSGMTVEEMEAYVASGGGSVSVDTGDGQVRDATLPGSSDELNSLARSVDEDDSDTEVYEKMCDMGIDIVLFFASLFTWMATGDEDYVS